MDAIFIILISYLTIGLIFLIAALSLGLWSHLRKDTELSHVTSTRLFVGVVWIHILIWPLFLYKVCVKLYRKMTEVSED